MQSWRLRFLGIDGIPGWLSDTEIEQFFTLTPGDIATIRTRRGATLQLGLALQIGFLRMSGCALNTTDVVPGRVLEFIGAQLDIKTPRVTSLRALYPRKPTLHEHQRLAQAQLKVRTLTDHAERQLTVYLRIIASSVTAPAELLDPARAWLHEHRYLIVNERHLLDLCRLIVHNDEKQLTKAINRQVTQARRQVWVTALTEAHPAITGINRLDWLKRAPRSRRGRDLADAFERVQFLNRLGIDTIELPPMPVTLVKAYAYRVARLKLTRFKRLRAITRDIGLPCYLQLTLWRTTDEAIEAWLMRVAEVRRLAMQRAVERAEIDWRKRHQELLAQVAALDGQPEPDLRRGVADLLAREQAAAPTRAELARQTLVGMSAHVRRLLRLILGLRIDCHSAGDWLHQAMDLLRQTYQKHRDHLDKTTALGFLPPLWRRGLVDEGAERLRLLEAATLVQLQRALRNGSVFVSGSLSFRVRDSLLIPKATWEARRTAYLGQLGSSRKLSDAVKAISPEVSEGLTTLARAVRHGEVTVGDDGIRLASGLDVPGDTTASERIQRLFASHVGTIELPRLMMEVDSEVRFSSTLLRRPPKHHGELMAVYGAVLAHGMGLDRVQVMRMIPEGTETVLRQTMSVLEEAERLADANASVVQFMRRHPVVEAWGEPGLASSDMMSVEASRRLWNARVDPRTGSYAIGTYTHVLDQWGIAYDQPIVLNRRQAGAAIEGVLFQRLVPINRLAVDTHGYTDVAMGLARLLGFELCPHLAMLRERKLYVPDGLYVPKPLRPVAVGISVRAMRTQWDEMLRLASSIREGWCNATQVLGHLGSDAQGDPLYQAAASFGRLVRTQYLCRYFANAEFRASIRRVLNHGESVHQLQRTIHPFAIGPKRGRSRDEQRAISGSLALLANLVMAWNTKKLQEMIDLPPHRRPDIKDNDLAGIGPVATSHINFRGVLHFPVAEFAEPILRPPTRLRTA